MSWDLVTELRQLSHDIIAMRIEDAIKSKHPAILDAAARRIVSLQDEIAELRFQIEAAKNGL